MIFARISKVIKRSRIIMIIWRCLRKHLWAKDQGHGRRLEQEVHLNPLTLFRLWRINMSLHLIKFSFQDCQPRMFTKSLYSHCFKRPSIREPTLLCSFMARLAVARRTLWLEIEKVVYREYYTCHCKTYLKYTGTWGVEWVLVTCKFTMSAFQIFFIRVMSSLLSKRSNFQA